MKNIGSIISGLAILLVMTNAFGQSQTPSQLRKFSDPAVDRNILFGTAETIGRGQVTINQYEVLFIGATYGLSDRVQTSLTVLLLPLFLDEGVVFAVSTKLKLLDTGRILLAVKPGLGMFAFSGGFAASGSLSGHVDFLLDRQGAFVVTLTGGVAAFLDAEGKDWEANDLYVLGGAAGFSARFGPIKLMLEIAMPVQNQIFTVDPEFDAETVLLNYGIRFFNKYFAFDFSLIKTLFLPPFFEPCIFGYPYITFNTRF